MTFPTHHQGTMKMIHEDKSIYLLSVVLSLYELAKAGKLDNAAVQQVTESALKRVGLPSYTDVGMRA